MADDHATANGAVSPVVETRSHQSCSGNTFTSAQHQCNICNKKFKSAGAREQHLQSKAHARVKNNTHGGPTSTVEAGQRPINTNGPPVGSHFRCKFCDKKFQSASALAVHYASGVHRLIIAGPHGWPRHIAGPHSWPSFVEAGEEGEREGEFLAAADANVEDYNYENFLADEAPYEEFEYGHGEFSSQLASADVTPGIVPGPPLCRKELQSLVAAMGELDVR
ncbi:hypothetical protein EST38_g2274 [Candolleomyces aberdarensis]|uniref:C2H2-type domain-containing protein n=1 Tax=Candolleomyces aberdarensis TaxID=2316362 RepID=A0A4Q2DV20_9AGAR|nr:hypothetical protein EST38_g2274 [Candolleomyces aberdarensis]